MAHKAIIYTHVNTCSSCSGQFRCHGSRTLRQILNFDFGFISVGYGTRWSTCRLPIVLVPSTYWPVLFLPYECNRSRLFIYYCSGIYNNFSGQRLIKASQESIEKAIFLACSSFPIFEVLSKSSIGLNNVCWSGKYEPHR
jgi:hypothetical protein